jgi:hypothetical protein
MKFRVPSALVVVLGLCGGALEFLNQSDLGFIAPWNQLITFGVYALAIFGVSPLVGSAFRNALHVSPALATTITTLAATLAASITTFSMSADLKGILEGILAFLAFVGFGPATSVP